MRTEMTNSVEKKKVDEISKRAPKKTKGGEKGGINKRKRQNYLRAAQFLIMGLG